MTINIRRKRWFFSSAELVFTLDREPISAAQLLLALASALEEVGVSVQLRDLEGALPNHRLITLGWSMVVSESEGTNLHGSLAVTTPFAGTTADGHFLTTPQLLIQGETPLQLEHKSNLFYLLPEAVGENLELELGFTLFAPSKTLFGYAAEPVATIMLQGKESISGKITVDEAWFKKQGDTNQLFSTLCSVLGIRLN